MRRAFGRVILRLAKKDKNIVLIAGDVEQEIKDFKEQASERYFNFGLCEQAMITAAAGMASQGLRPVVYSITPFILERPFEQVKIDVDEQNLPVILIGNSDYPTHGPTHRPLDAEYLCRIFKNINSFFPQSEMQAEKAIIDAYLMSAPAIICLKNDRMPFL